MHRLRDESYSEDLLELHEESRKAADVVEVVRCKDCRHSGALVADGTPLSVYCIRWGRPIWVDGFCHEGERRE